VGNHELQSYRPKARFTRGQSAMEAESPKVRGLHLLATIDLDLYARLRDYCKDRGLIPSRVVNNALSLYLTGKPRPEEQKCKGGRSAQWHGQLARQRKIAISVHIDADLVVLLEEYCHQHNISLSTVVNRALAALLMPLGLAGPTSRLSLTALLGLLALAHTYLL
jgi:hypothetical protein